MGTRRQIESAKANARKSTGPRTAGGIARCKFNALAHGLRSQSPVIRGESSEGWLAHLEEVVRDLEPLGAVELALAQRVADHLWRMGRVSRHEAALVDRRRHPDEVEAAYDRERPGDLETIRKARHEFKQFTEMAAEIVAVVDGLPKLREMDPGEAVPFDPSWLWWLVRFVTGQDEREEAEARAKGPAAILRHRMKDKLPDVGVCTVADALEILADWKLDPLELADQYRRVELPDMQDSAARMHSRIQALEEKRRKAIRRLSLASRMPAAEDAELVMRYEAHLERGLKRAIDQLAELQQGRGAWPRPLPDVAVVIPPADPVRSAVSARPAPKRLEAPRRG